MISSIVFFACLLTNKEKNTPKKSFSSFDGLGSVFVLIFFSLTVEKKHPRSKMERGLPYLF
jgi:hypothetical protein